MSYSATVDIAVDDLRAARRKLRVAMVTETYPPEVNGVSLSVAHAVQGLRARQHTVQLVRLRQDGVDPADSGGTFGATGDEVLLRGLPIPRYPHLKMGLPCTGALESLWTQQRPDVVHIATEGPLGWSALRAAQRLKLPVVSDFRTNFHAYSRHYGMGWLYRPIAAYLRRFHNRTQRTMVPTEALRRELAGQGFERLSVVSRGVDTRLFTPTRRDPALRAAWGAGPDTVVLLCVGRIAPEKNLGLLWASFQAARQTGADLRLVVVGDGPSRSELQREWPGALFVGTQRGEDLAAHYASADLFVFPSLTETFGNVVTEAMASGLPLVAHEYAAAAELVQHVDNGLLAACGDRAHFADLVCEAVSSPAHRQAMGRRARETALLHDWDEVISDLELVLLGAMVDRRAGVRPIVLRPAIG